MDKRKRLQELKKEVEQLEDEINAEDALLICMQGKKVKIVKSGALVEGRYERGGGRGSGIGGARIALIPLVEVEE